jgi:hypothetical protein
VSTTDSTASPEVSTLWVLGEKFLRAYPEVLRLINSPDTTSPKIICPHCGQTFSRVCGASR